MTNTEYNRVYMLKLYHDRRQEATTFLGNACSVSGCENKELLLVSPKTKFSKVYASGVSSFHKVLKEAQFRLLCRTHMTQQQRPIKHGAYNAYYRRGCRCDECTEWRADYNLRRCEDRRAVNK